MADCADQRPQDKNANTLRSVLKYIGKTDLPVLSQLGLRHINAQVDSECLGHYGRVKLQHEGADSYLGHQEIMGSKVKKPIIQPFSQHIKTIAEHLIGHGFHVEFPEPEFPYLVVDGCIVVADNVETEYGQVYNVTGATSEVGFEVIENVGRCVREVAGVNRVIALGGSETNKYRIFRSLRKTSEGAVGVDCPNSGVYLDNYQVVHLGYGIDPSEQAGTLITKAGYDVHLIGKMQDVVRVDGATRKPSVETELVMKSVLESMNTIESGLVAATVQETDLAGHAQNVELYAKTLSIVDRYLERIVEEMQPEDLLILTADHGNDPLIGHSQHTREETILIVYQKNRTGKQLETRETLADIGATITDYFGVRETEGGTSFINDLNRQ